MTYLKSNISLVEKVKTQRKSLGLSLRDLAKVTGVSFSTLSRIERKIGPPSENTLMLLLDWLDLDPKEKEEAFRRMVLETSKLKAKIEEQKKEEAFEKEEAFGRMFLEISELKKKIEEQNRLEGARKKRKKAYK